MSAAVHVLLYVTNPEDSPSAVETAYHTVSRALNGTPGLIGNKLLRSTRDPSAYAVHSEWTDLAAFRAWEEGSSHRGTTAALRPLQSSSHASAFGVYEVVAAY